METFCTNESTVQMINDSILKTNEVRAFAPATVANVGCGFDIFGLALEYPGDEVSLCRVDEPGVHIASIEGDEGRLPLEAAENTAGKSLLAMLAHLDAGFGIRMTLKKQMPIGSGLGSSAASSVASVFALNNMLRSPLSLELLLHFAIEGERITSGGSVHLDNIAACLYGGFVLIRDREPADIVRIPVPDDLFITIMHPMIEVKTSESRRMIKANISLPQAVTQWGNVAGVITALFLKDYDLLKRSMRDVIIEPVRAMLIPHFYTLRDTAMDLGAYGFGISGSGPSVFAISRSRQKAEEIGDALRNLMLGKGIDNDIYVSVVNKQGPRLITDSE